MKLASLATIVWVILLEPHLVTTGTPVDPSVLAAINQGIEVSCKLALIISITDIVWRAWKYAQSYKAGRWQLV